MNIENTMAALYDELEAAANKYYNGLDSGMDDSVYDNRYDYLCSLELRYPQFVRHGSITERVGAKPLSSLQDRKSTRLNSSHSSQSRMPSSA